MNKKRLKDLLFSNSFIIMVILGIIMIIIISVTENILFRHLYNSTIKGSIASISRYYNNGIKYLEFHSSNYEEILSETLDEAYSNYKKNNRQNIFSIPEIKFLKEKQIIKNVNYYIIDKNGIIIETDYTNDLGLNLSLRVPEYWRNLKKKLENDKKFIGKISFEVKTNNPRIYGYKVMENGNIFEVGLLLNEKNIPNFLKDISVIKFNFIEGIYTYNNSYIPFSSDYPLLDNEEKDIFSKLKYSDGEIKDYIIKEKSDGKKVYIYFKWRPSGDEKSFNFAALTKVEINFSDIVKVKNYLIYISMLVIGGFILIFAMVIGYNSRKVEKPLIRLIKNIENGKVEEVETNVLEIDTLIKYYSHLVTTLSKKISEEENELLNLKKKFEMIEKEKELLYDMALKDDLTKLFNKKGSIKVFQKIISNKESFCVIYISLDNYKSVLEQHGKNEANEMILELVGIIKKTIRDRDFVFRIGEEEFLIVLRYLNLEITQKILKRLVDFVKKFNITTDKVYKISISYGLLEYSGQDIESIFIDSKKRMKEMKDKKKELLRRLKNND
ncbi:GGDEF domain-containing protein [Marinitoga aeolica]|uniref:GGDEF domain-containing protein n=1 Tax=Marinitoga aeolica TaxID=2809031 RepID=A0ABY8PSC6_9BACT|nr:GGDEF domain-containing protein [Marinitoga aeolica]WGS65542.1 GGDEF domain-containing protein [Marinitoga aeolica]